jgi:PilZ domain-containing protein
MLQNAQGAIALNSPPRQSAKDQASPLGEGQVVIFEEERVMQIIEKPVAKGLRRSVRIPKEVAILLIGCDARGREFVEQTKTVVLSRRGAGIVSMHKLVVEQELIIIQEPSRREVEIRVVGEIGSENRQYTYGVTFLDPHIDFWGIEFPPVTDDGTSDSDMVLECSICGRREVIEADALESDIFAIHDGLLRDCKHCHRSTLWKRASEEVPDKIATPQAVAVSSETPLPETSPSSAPFKNRRRHVRTKVSFTCSVRNHCFDDDIALCENISRGGLCFKSSKRYYETAGIEVAAPYSPGSACIRVPAQIVYVQELPDEKMFRYGVQYIHLTKDPRA